MKSKIFSIILILATMLGFYSCDNGLDPAPEAYGQLKLSSLGVEVDNSETSISRAAVNTDSYLVVITNSAGEVRGKYVFSEMPQIVSLPVGDYSVEVKSHELQKAEWDKPFFCGSKEFKISDGQISEIGTVVCKFSSLKVSVAYTEALKQSMGDDCRVTVVANDEGRLEYTPEESRIGCFAVIEGSNTLVAAFNGSINGSPAQVLKTFNSVAPGQHYKLTFGLKNGPSAPDETGSIDLGNGVSISLDVIDQDLDGSIDDDETTVTNPTRPGEDPILPGDTDPKPPVDPSVPTDPTEPTVKIFSETFNIDEENDCSPRDYIVIITSEHGLTNLKVTINSSDNNFMADLPGMGVPLSFDLAYPGENEAVLKGFNFPVGKDVIGKDKLEFNISTFIPLLNTFHGEHKFTLTAVDSKSSVTKTLTFVSE